MNGFRPDVLGKSIVTTRLYFIENIIYILTKLNIKKITIGEGNLFFDYTPYVKLTIGNIVPKKKNYCVNRE